MAPYKTYEEAQRHQWDDVAYIKIFSDSTLILRDESYGYVKYGKTLRSKGFWKDEQRTFHAKSGGHATQIAELFQEQTSE
eukprot:11789542-Prorocentrum_lima.AAC.1